MIPANPEDFGRVRPITRQMPGGYAASFLSYFLFDYDRKEGARMEIAYVIAMAVVAIVAILASRRMKR